MVSEPKALLEACRHDMDIADWRKKIDEIDRTLVKLLNQRARCVVEIGKIKRQNRLPVRELNREEEVLRHALDANRGPLANEAMRRVFGRIVQEGRSLQHSLFDGGDPKAGKGTGRKRNERK